MAGEIKYAKRGDSHIAYRVFGDGPRDIVVVPGTVSHVELYWELPANAYLLKRLARVGRVIVFDKRGQGLSDRIADHTLDERVSDVLAVMDAVGSSRAGIYGWSEGGPLSLTLAARYPERVSQLVLYGSYASLETPRETFDSFLEMLEAKWGEGILVLVNAPSRRKDAAFVQWCGRLERAVASPGAILALFRANYALDVRDLLPTIRVPTLIFHRTGDALVPVAAGRGLAEKIPGAKYVELPGTDHMLQALDQTLLEQMMDRIEAFLTGSAPQSSERTSSPPSFEERVATSEAGASLETIAELERYRELLGAGGNAEALAAIVARAEAVAAAKRGAWSEAESQFLEAARSFRRHGMVWQEAQTFQRWGQALLEAAQPSDTEQTLRRAGEQRKSNHARAMPDASRGMFRREGEYWSLAWQGNVTRMKDAKGLYYIAYLLAHPGREIFASVLASARTPASLLESVEAHGLTSRGLSDAGPVFDARAFEQYRLRIRELGEDLADAERRNDIGYAERLRSELDSLREQIAAATGLGGRSRKSASDTERARLMVTKAIKSSLARIKAGDAALGHHLSTTIRTGNVCSYEPGPAPPAWDL